MPENLSDQPLEVIAVELKTPRPAPTPWQGGHGEATRSREGEAGEGEDGEREESQEELNEGDEAASAGLCASCQNVRRIGLLAKVMSHTDVAKPHDRLRL